LDGKDRTLFWPARRIAIKYRRQIIVTKGVNTMDETTTVGDHVGIVRTTQATTWPTPARSGLSWGAVIAGALTAIAVTIIVIALGTGIGLSLASPYSYSPSGSTLTLIGAVWLVFAQAVGFAVGGYIAGRSRRDPVPLRTTEVKFRDGANGLTVWAIGVVVSMVVVAAGIGKVGDVVGTAVSGTTSLSAGAAMSGQLPSMDYFADTLLRPNPQTSTAGAATGTSTGTETGQNSPAPNTANVGQRAQVSRIMLTALGPNGLSGDDRSYLAQLVSTQTGLSQDDARHRVDTVVDRVKQDATQAADTARKAAAYLSFWTFMSLLFGAACATLGGMLGGDLRDEAAIRNAVPTSPR
jgi:hypothetical protein